MIISISSYSIDVRYLYLRHMLFFYTMSQLWSAIAATRIFATISSYVIQDCETLLHRSTMRLQKCTQSKYATNACYIADWIYFHQSPPRWFFSVKWHCLDVNLSILTWVVFLQPWSLTTGEFCGVDIIHSAITCLMLMPSLAMYYYITSAVIDNDDMVNAVSLVEKW